MDEADHKTNVAGEPTIAGRRRVGSHHRTVDHDRQPGQAEGTRPPLGPATTPAEGRTLDPYNPEAPGEDAPEGSPARPKVRPVHEASEDGRLIENARREKS